MVTRKQRRSFALSLLALLTLSLAQAFYMHSKKKVTADSDLVILAYSSFVTAWGPGPSLAQAFEKRTGMKVRLIDGGDSQTLLDRFRFSSRAPRADVVIGFDQFSLLEAERLAQWKPLHMPRLNWHKDLPVSAHAFFQPFDWSPLTLIARKGSVQISTLNGLLKPELKKSVALQDPRTSTPGFQFLQWVYQLHRASDADQFFSQLKPQLTALYPSWTLSYAAFKSGEAKLTFSYLTSPLYHLIEEDDASFEPLALDVPLPYQVEYAAVPASCHHCARAREFIALLVEPEQQKIIMKKNYMLPVIAEAVEPPFDLVIPELMPAKFTSRRELLAHWKSLWQ